MITNIGNEICDNLKSILTTGGTRDLGIVCEVIRQAISQTDNNLFTRIPIGDEIFI